MKAVIEVEVDGREVDCSLTIDGCPLSGHGDTTGSLPVGSLLAPLVATAVARAEQARREPPDRA